MSATRGSVRIATTCLVSLFFLMGCQEEKVTGPTTADRSREHEAIAAKVAIKKAKAKKKAPKAVAEAKLDAASFAAVDFTFRYDERGKRDPFRSFKWEHLALAQKHDAMRGPLEQFDVAQLSLVAVVWKTGSPKALVSDPSGHAYVVGAGSRIGKNRGRVVTIDDNLVLIKETYVDYLGHETTKDIEMRIRRSHGG